MLTFSVVNNPDYSPGICRNCGGCMDRSYWIDLGYVEDFYGHVYLCNVCFEQMADVAGFEKKRSEPEPTVEPERWIYATIFDRLFGADADPESILTFLDKLDAPPIVKAFAVAMESRTQRASKSDNESRSDNISNAPNFDAEPQF